LTLDDSVEVHPAHGAGSACGRNISKEMSSTIGEQRRTNDALRPMAKEDFVALMTSDLPDPPTYFSMDAEINRRGAGLLSTIEAKALTAAEVNERLLHGAVALDVRESSAFANGHLPRALNIGLKGNYAPWSGNLIRPSDALILVAEGKDQVDEAVMRLARVGLENVVGYLDGGIAAWDAAGLELETVPQISVGELHARLNGDGRRLQIVDVRAPGEFAPDISRARRTCLCRSCRGASASSMRVSQSRSSARAGIAPPPLPASCSGTAFRISTTSSAAPPRGPAPGTKPNAEARQRSCRGRHQRHARCTRLRPSVFAAYIAASARPSSSSASSPCCG
jgi:rhodanese-related sulfurtransferase